MIGTKKCRRCRDYFYPSQGKQKFCPYCQGKSTIKGRPMKTKFCRVFSCGKERKPGEGARGLCKEHYNKKIMSDYELELLIYEAVFLLYILAIFLRLKEKE